MICFEGADLGTGASPLCLIFEDHEDPFLGIKPFRALAEHLEGVAAAYFQRRWFAIQPLRVQPLNLSVGTIPPLVVRAFSDAHVLASGRDVVAVGKDLDELGENAWGQSTGSHKPPLPPSTETRGFRHAGVQTPNSLFWLRKLLIKLIGAQLIPPKHAP